MGFWSTSLYGNDTTCDVRDRYIKYLQDGLGNTEAYERIMNDYKKMIDDEEEALFWFALAETQWKTGRLMPEVREKALYWIENAGGLEGWEESPKGALGWTKTLEKLKTKLQSPMPKEKKFRKPVLPDKNPWEMYDMYVFQMHGWRDRDPEYSGKYIVLHKVGEIRDTTSLTGKTMVLQIYDRMFDSIPSIEDLKQLRILPLDFPQRPSIEKTGIIMCVSLLQYNNKEYPSEYLTYLGNVPHPSNTCRRLTEWGWYTFNCTWEFMDRWKDIEYDTVSEGVYEYHPLKAK
ncbi:hypothetical protein [Anaerocolumna xylanovorans]|uniref:Uncharacterized protein n=1 Tax=Anaerocolumna xylanovorans DSM 12503 TaxID=1121345 RepID=A0A1M7YNL3_9FIRM|nr:hypothetical protein [Anaerocolumna xylanovorans]SHO54185.1 hypothetical protein SAMN02745217_04640 [Anaerocolumna xylanovorans DSM 12503]